MAKYKENATKKKTGKTTEETIKEKTIGISRYLSRPCYQGEVESAEEGERNSGGTKKRKKTETSTEVEEEMTEVKAKKNLFPTRR